MVPSSSRHDLHLACSARSPSCSGLDAKSGRHRWLLHHDDLYYKLVNKSTTTLHHDLDTQAVKINNEQPMAPAGCFT